MHPRLTGKDYRAIGVYARQNGLRLALSTPPQISFMDGDNLITVDLDRVVGFYDSYKKQAAKERARERKANAKKEEKS